MIYENSLMVKVVLVAKVVFIPTNIILKAKIIFISAKVILEFISISTINNLASR